MNIVFFGSGAFGLPSLAAIARRHNILAVVTQPDRPSGRGKKLTPTPIAAWCGEALDSAPVLKPANVNEQEASRQILDLPADAFVVIAFGQKIGPELLESRLAMNLHGSRLPRWRGAAPINHAILAGDSVTGNSVIALAQRMDAGTVYAMSERPIEAHQTAGDLHDLLASDGPDLLLETLSAAEGGRIAGTEQDESLVTLAPKLSREDAWIDFTQSSEECRRRINALSPWPGIGALLDGKRVKLLRALPEQGANPGEAGTLADAGQGVVRCAGGTLVRIAEVQPDGRSGMTWDEFARGRRLKGSMVIQGERACARSGI